MGNGKWGMGNGKGKTGCHTTQMVSNHRQLSHMGLCEINSLKYLMSWIEPKWFAKSF